LRNQPTPECTSATLTNIGGPDELCRPDENGAITLGIEVVNNDLVRFADAFPWVVLMMYNAGLC
jgi:hypothetical protein